MRNEKSAVGRLAVVATTLTALSATAGIKYWDNQDYKAYDVGDYATNAVWNLDGIRNAGAAAAHSTTALTWKNLGASGDSNDVFLQKNTGSSSWGTATAAELSAGTYGEWTGNGFVFKGNSRMRANSPKRIDTGTNYTIQFLVDANVSDQTANNAVVFNSNWSKLSFAINKSSSALHFRTMESVAVSSHPSIAGSSFDYATAIADGDTGTTAFFSGTEVPTSGDGFRQYSSISGQSEAGYGFGATGDSTSLFNGTLKFFRYYQRVLTAEELAWNRVIDERRFFDRAAPLPVTNVVVATAVAGLEGVEPAGCYAVDEEGHTFTAPAVARLNGVKYRCVGYTLEMWDDDSGDWGAAVWHGGERSCAATDTSRLRIVWQWKEATGLGVYDVHDYVWDGLELFYDGICNAGTNAAHSSTALTWKNLGSAGAANDMFLQLLNAGGTAWTTATGFDEVDGRAPGAWTDTGFALAGDSRFRVVNTGGSNGAINTGTDYSLQTLINANAADQADSSAFVFSLSADKYSFVLYKSGRLDWRSDSASSSGTPLSMSGTSFDYATAIANSTDNTLALFSGTNFPSDGDGYRQLESITAHGQERGYDLGGYGNSNYDKLLTGTIKHFRQYDHSLSAAEVLQNRKVDDFRYFGRATGTNVVVQSTYGALQGYEASGAYEVTDAYTFTAPATATISVNGKAITYACAGYTVETWDGSAWSNSVLREGVYAFEYTSGSSPSSMRLTWLWKPVSGIRTAADYSFADYSQAGLVWNYDGIRNQGGTDADHDSMATTWKNLGSGANADLHWNNKTTTGHWADDGYVFAGGPRFKGDASFGPLKSFTLQTLVDADTSAQTASSTFGSIFCGMYQYFNLYLITESFNGSAAGSLCWRAQNDGKYMYFKTPSRHYDYATAIMDYDAMTAKIFPGVDVPDTPAENDYNSAGDKQRTCYQFSSVATAKDTGYGLGQRGNETTWGMVGTLKNFRYYDRVLTDEEIVRNRNADAVRYFGALGVTNVLVRTRYGDGTGEVLAEAPGAYKVEGSWTFSATSVKDANGNLCSVAGYYTETLVDGVWTGRAWHDGTSYTYDAEAEGNAAIRLTWSVPPPGLTVILL